MGKILDIQNQNKKTYKKIKFSFRNHKDRLNRTMYVVSDINLFDLGIAMGASLGCSFQHLFAFFTKEQAYSNDVLSKGDLPVEQHYLSELGPKFEYCYDFGDDWTFDCSVYKKEEEFNSDSKAFIVDGVGQGIWEDNRWTLEAYLDGDIEPDCKEENEQMGYCFPWNFEIEKYGDFDNPLNFEDINDDIDLCVSSEGACTGTIPPLDDDFYENELDDMDEEEEFQELLDEFLSEAFMAHALYVPFISEKLMQTKGKKNREAVLSKIFDRFCEEINTVIQQDKSYSSKKYKEDIEKIK